MSTASPHIPFERLTDLAEGRLPAGERAKSLAHLSSCPGCAFQLARLEYVIKLMRTDAAIDPPEAVLARALNIFR